MKLKSLIIILPIFLLTYVLAAQELYQNPGNIATRISSFENKNGEKGQGGKTNLGAKGNAFEEFGPGETKVLLDVKGTGIIQRIWLTYTRNPVLYRSLRLRMYWDDDPKPAVDVPLGDFFLNNLGKPTPFESALFSNPEGKSYNCFIQMPFRTAAKIIITNESDSSRLKLFYDVDFVSMESLPKDALYFHAYWNRQSDGDLGTDVQLLPKVNGIGRFLGVNVGMNVNAVYKNTWWGEGEVKMYIDDDGKFPGWVGTGAEDYLGTGWGLGVYDHQYQGCLIADRSPGRYSFYRWHVPDAIYFQQNIQVVLQQIGGDYRKSVKKLSDEKANLKIVSSAGPRNFHRLLETPIDISSSDFPDGWVNFYRIDDYAFTSYFYLNKPSASLPALPGLSIRMKNYNTGPAKKDMELN